MNVFFLWQFFVFHNAFRCLWECSPNTGAFLGTRNRHSTRPTYLSSTFFSGKKKCKRNVCTIRARHLILEHRPVALANALFDPDDIVPYMFLQLSMIWFGVSYTYIHKIGSMRFRVRTQYVYVSHAKHARYTFVECAQSKDAAAAGAIQRRINITTL